MTLTQTAEDYERLLLGSPHSSYLWLRYMSFQVGRTELELALTLTLTQALGVNSSA